MTNEMWGANLDTLERFGAELERSNQILTDVWRIVRVRLQSAPWEGPNAEQFRALWEGPYRRQLEAAAAAFRTGSQVIARNVAAQRQTSAANAPALRRSSAVWRAGTTPALGWLWSHPIWLSAGAVSTAIGFLPRGPELWAGGWDGFTGVRRDGHGETRLGPVDLSGDWEADAGIKGRASAGLSTEGGNLVGAVAVGGSIGVGAAASGAAALGPITTRGGVSGFGGVRADATGEFRAGVDGLQAKAGVDAFAGVEAGVEGEIDFAGMKAGGGAEVYAGVGAHANVDASVTYDRVSVGVDVGAALGVGGGFKMNVSVSPKDVVKSISDWGPF